uniref:Syndecan n=1 Tax=Meloidogyne javanica TaxID=6303 RepID=A0A915MQQ0_MELJA
MLAFFEGSSIISFRILPILLLFTLTTCQSNNQNLPTSIANQVDSKLDEVEPLSIPQRNSQDDFEGSGVNPDDEDGDVDEGSGDGIEGSGSPPIDDNAQIDTQMNANNIEEIRKVSTGSTGVPVYTKTNGTAAESEIIVGGAVVFVLLIILVITYIFYRIRKKDEGSYICEDHVQTHRFSNYYQKASTKEFYA